MNVLVIGTWYVWLTHGACLSKLGHHVVCIDINEQKITQLQQNIIPIYEPWLAEVVGEGISTGRLHFATSLQPYIADAQIIFIAVGTPPGKDGHADLQYVQAVAKEIAQLITDYKIIVTKSTVPVGTGDMIKEILQHTIEQRNMTIEFDVVSNPEFLKEGTAVEDFFEGERIVMWCDNPNNKALDVLSELYAWLTSTYLLKTDLHSAELIKYSANALLAMEISFINSMAQICEVLGADVTVVSQWLKLDSRIGKKAFLNAGPGFGGSCFPKDVMELAATCQSLGIPNPLLEATLTINDLQKKHMVTKITSLVPDVAWKTISLLWLAFKADTDDIRYASSITLVDELTALWATIRVYDPQAMSNFRLFYPDLIYTESEDTCIQGSDCVVVLTDRKQFHGIDRNEAKKQVKQCNIVDARNMYDPIYMRSLGRNYSSVGRK